MSSTGLRGHRVGVLILLALLVAAVGCKAEAAPPDVLQHSVDKLKAAQSFHFDGGGSIAVKDDKGTSLSMEFKTSGDAELPARTRASVSMSAFGRSFETEFITIDKQIWQKDPRTGAWSPIPQPLATASTTNPLTNLPDVDGVRDLKELEPTTLDGKRTRHLRFAVDSERLRAKVAEQGLAPPEALKDISALEGQVEVWIRAEDERLLRQLFNVSVTAQAATMTMTMDLTYSKFGEPVTPAIAPPAVR